MCHWSRSIYVSVSVDRKVCIIEVYMVLSEPIVGKHTAPWLIGKNELQ